MLTPKDAILFKIVRTCAMKPKDAILFKIVHTCAKECLILTYIICPESLVVVPELYMHSYVQGDVRTYLELRLDLIDLNQICVAILWSNILLVFYESTRGVGVTFTKIVRGCACRTSKIWLSLGLYQFFAQFPTHQYTIFWRKVPNSDQIGCFLL